jgi:hypothetical protein
MQYGQNVGVSIVLMMRPLLFWDVTQCKLTDVITNLRCVTSQKSEDLVYTTAEASNHEWLNHINSSSVTRFHTQSPYISHMIYLCISYNTINSDYVLYSIKWFVSVAVTQCFLLGTNLILHACNETNLMHYLSSVHSVTIPLHVSRLLVAHHQEVTMYICDNWYVLYVLVDCRRAGRQSTKTYVMHKVGFIIRIYWDARSTKHKNVYCTLIRIPLTYTFSFIYYENIMFDLRLPLSQEHNWAAKGGLLVGI